MRSLMDAAEGTPEYDKLLEQFVDFQLEIQNTPASDLMKDQKTKIAGMVGKVKELDPSVRYDLQMRADRMAPGRSICHCDYNPSNVIVAEDGTLYCCDWTHVTRGLPEADAAMTYILFKMYHPGHAEAYLDVFSKKADIAKQKVHYWVPVMAAAELSRGRKDAEEFLRSQVDAALDIGGDVLAEVARPGASAKLVDEKKQRRRRTCVTSVLWSSESRLQSSSASCAGRSPLASSAPTPSVRPTP